MSEIEAVIERGCTHFDHHSKEFRDHPFEIYDRLRATDPVHYTEAWNGYWVLTRYDDVARVARDDENFSSEMDGIMQPPFKEKTYPISLDPPESMRIKNLITPYFTPKVLQQMLPHIRDLITQLIDDVIEKGECEYVYDIGLPLTGIITMEMAGFDTSSYREFADMIHRIVYAEEDFEKLKLLQQKMMKGITDEIERQKTEPRSTGFIADLLERQKNGEDITDTHISGIIENLFAGGLDTTQANTGHTLVYFQKHPELRKQFLEQPGMRVTMLEEALRLMAPIQGLFRTVVNDQEIGGKTLRKGDRVMLCWAAANRDPEKFEKADTFIPDRKPNLHMCFGLGSHRCLGSSLARFEIMTQLEEILTRMPDYKIDESQLGLANSIGIVYGHRKVPMTFTPGKPVGVKAA